MTAIGTTRRDWTSDDAYDSGENVRLKYIQKGRPSIAGGMSVVRDLFRVQQILLAQIDAVLRPLDLTWARYEVLMQLLTNESHSGRTKDLSDVLQVHATSVSASARRLADQGLVDQSPDREDRRVVLVSITSRGKSQALIATQALCTAVFEPLQQSIQPPDRLWKVLRSFRANAGDF